MKLSILVNTALAVIAIALAASGSTVPSLGEGTPGTAGQDTGYVARETGVLTANLLRSP
jgi:hypothetical protein